MTRQIKNITSPLSYCLCSVTKLTRVVTYCKQLPTIWSLNEVVLWCYMTQDMLNLLLQKVLIYREKLPPLDPQDSTIWSCNQCEVTWQTEKFISSLSHGLSPLYFAGYCVAGGVSTHNRWNCLQNFCWHLFSAFLPYKVSKYLNHCRICYWNQTFEDIIINFLIAFVSLTEVVPWTELYGNLTFLPESK